MARITSQKAIEALGGNQFLLITIATYRARQLSSGKAQPLVETKGNKWPVVAVREIEEGKYTKEDYEADINAPVSIEDPFKGDNDEY